MPSENSFRSSFKETVHEARAVLRRSSVGGFDAWLPTDRANRTAAGATSASSPFKVPSGRRQPCSLQSVFDRTRCPPGVVRWYDRCCGGGSPTQHRRGRSLHLRGGLPIPPDRKQRQLAAIRRRVSQCGLWVTERAMGQPSRQVPSAGLEGDGADRRHDSRSTRHRAQTSGTAEGDSGGAKGRARSRPYPIGNVQAATTTAARLLPARGPSD
jgi:hypothetical protein